MKKLILITIMFFISSSCINKEMIEETLNLALEEAYFEGQKDAISGDIRIKKDDSGYWYWYKSPWNNNREPVFNPKLQKKTKGCK
jgi:hypothetical protein